MYKTNNLLWNKQKRLVIVSNRLPVNIKKKDSEVFEVTKSVGGLVTSIGSFLEKNSNISYRWIGWSGINVNKEEQEIIIKLLKQWNYSPIFLNEKEMDKFYLGFCNKTLWPLFHYFSGIATFQKESYDIYKSVNIKFAEVVASMIDVEKDILWIHDYHLMLLPSLLRDRYPSLPIGFFLHIPFPASEVFQFIPSKWRKEILNGLLGSDLIGFQTEIDTSNFSKAVLKFLGIENQLGIIHYFGRQIKISSHPISINFEKFQNALNLPTIKAKISEIKQELKGNKKMIFSVDRLDYTKGLVNRLVAYENFLEKHPEWREKIILYIVVVPSRIGVFHYQQMKKQIDELIGKINGKFSTFKWSPIIYKYGHLEFEELVALYNIADIMLVTPLRDGMNLVSKEFIASKNSNGVLILSETTGASKSLIDALIVNPNDIEEIGEAIHIAIKMPLSEQNERLIKLQTFIKKNDVNKWAENFLSELILISQKRKQYETKLLNDKILNQILDKYRNAKNTIIFLDYDGTLVEFSEKPDDAIVSKDTKLLLKSITNKNTEIVIISGRNKDFLSKHFLGIPVTLIAEHGAFYKFPQQLWKKNTITTESSWKKNIKKILLMYCDRLSGSFVEEKKYSLVFHYRKSEPESAYSIITDMMDYLKNLLANTNIGVYKGNKIIEIKPFNISKGCITELFDLNSYDLIIALGDDYTDEEMFKALLGFNNSITIKVGNAFTNAQYYLKSIHDVQRFLQKIAYS
ncbi:MAG: bifunctional alpha,alpha-trehalose-phosphate synthase (UDP-forming)/trehalose-phosphatase [Bacteroidia bacterium]|nr:MAG: bifunctional alpha,alpha-trehalose-phosphate synthase (UDP-forming)/trehalose-phosphatase [Bacteroidia bacterium]